MSSKRPDQESEPYVGTELAVAPDPSGVSGRDAHVVGLFQTQYRSLVKMAALLLGEKGQAEEVVQEGFLRLWNGWQRVRDEQDAAAYLRATILNLCRSSIRRRKIARLYRMRQLSASSASEEVAADESVLFVIGLLRSLPSRQRECLVLKHYLELTEDEIASTLGISKSSVKTHLKRGKETLNKRTEMHHE